ncbi:MAG: peptidase M14 [Deltaproteobacteria bacterium]|nr:peptidase M14 [Deltaproteobacteria bacterium]
MDPRLAALAQPFRADYLDWDGVDRQLAAWTQAFPDLCRVELLGRTEGGREIPVLVIGRDPDRYRPAVWIDANMHASELAGSSVALGIAEDVLALHLDPELTLHGLSRAACDVVRDGLFYVLPRMSPDGAEQILKSGRWVRSVPRDPRHHQLHPHWLHEDVDGDGLALAMRVPDPGGEYVALEGHPSALRPRLVEDEGPFYRLYPEGRVAGFDGDSVPDPWFLSDNATDLNRNFPVEWRSEPDQAGAGLYAMSEVEAHAVVAYTAERPHLFAWLNLHTYGGVFIRPLGDKPDTAMDAEELAYYTQLAQWGEAFTGYPTVSGFEEFTYTPDKPLYGDIIAWAHRARGCFSFVVELWDLFEQLGLPRPKRFVDRYERLGREELQKLAAFDTEHNAGRLFPAWREVEHPQLGKVEVGGFDPRIGLWNPPPDRLAGIVSGMSAVMLRVAAMAPRVVVTTEVVSHDGAAEVVVKVANHGYLPTYVLPSAKALPMNEPLWLEVVATSLAVELAGSPRVKLGHLEGWGRGRFNPAQSILFPRSRGTRNEAVARLHTRGHGGVTIRVGSCRVGFQTFTVEV